MNKIITIIGPDGRYKLEEQKDDMEFTGCHMIKRNTSLYCSIYNAILEELNTKEDVGAVITEVEEDMIYECELDTNIIIPKEIIGTVVDIYGKLIKITKSNVIKWSKENEK